MPLDTTAKAAAPTAWINLWRTGHGHRVAELHECRLDAVEDATDPAKGWAYLGSVPLAAVLEDLRPGQGMVYRWHAWGTESDGELGQLVVHAPDLETALEYAHEQALGTGLVVERIDPCPDQVIHPDGRMEAFSGSPALLRRRRTMAEVAAGRATAQEPAAHA